MQERELYQTNNLTQSLSDVFCSIGEVAYKTETPICFFIDEIQYMNQRELGAVITALHRNKPTRISTYDCRRRITQNI